jgi:hypothetical protein
LRLDPGSSHRHRVFESKGLNQKDNQKKEARMSSQVSDNAENRYLLRDLVGYVIPVVGTIVCFGIAYYVSDTHKLVYDIARDIGIAFFVALVVTIIYEVYARGRYERKKFINTLQVIMNEIVHPGVWEEVRNQVIERALIRENSRIKLTLEQQAGLTNGQMVLCLEHEYAIRSLRSKPVAVTILHYLDNHIESKEHDLPKFERIEIGKKNYSGDKLKEKIEKGVFSVALTLKARDKDKTPVRVRTWRKEITYVPGSYNLIMGEICDGVMIDLDQIPPGIVAHVHVWPHTEKPIPLEVDKTLDLFRDKILLPGQGCEFRFTPENTFADKPIIAVTSPSEGQNVQDDGWVEGKANLPANSFLWLLLGVAALPDQWWPQGGSVVQIKEDLSWKVRVFYGQRGEVGRFKIAAIVVDRKTNKRLEKWCRVTVTSGNYLPVALPQPIEDQLIQMIAVEKARMQLVSVKNINEASETIEGDQNRRGEVKL